MKPGVHLVVGPDFQEAWTYASNLERATRWQWVPSVGGVDGIDLTTAKLHRIGAWAEHRDTWRAAAHLVRAMRLAREKKGRK